MFSAQTSPLVLRNFAAGCSSASGHQQPVFTQSSAPFSVDKQFLLYPHPRPLCRSYARDEAATLTWRRDVGVRAIAAVLGQGSSGRATLDGSIVNNQGGFGVPNVVAPSLSNRHPVQAVALGGADSAISISKSPIHSRVSAAGARACSRMILDCLERACGGDNSLQVNKVETVTQKSHDQHQQALHQQLHELEQHQGLGSVPFVVEDGASSSSSSLASSPVARSPVIELKQRSPSPCSLAGSSSSLRREQLGSVSSSSRFLRAAAVWCPICSDMHAGVPVAVGTDAPPRL